MLVFLLSIFLSCGQNKTSPPQVSQSEVQETIPLDQMDYQSGTYNFSQADAIYILDSKLREISSLAFNDIDSTFLANDDERGHIYVLEREAYSITKDIKFGKKGDYEGIEIVDSIIYVAKSSGTIYAFDLKEKSTEILKNQFSSKNDIEGLCYDQENNQLLLACKGVPLKTNLKNKRTKSIYAFDLSTKKLSVDPYLSISDSLLVAQLNQSYAQISKSNLKKLTNKLNSFSPSGIVIHPTTQDIYIISAKGSSIVIFDKNKILKEVAFLNSKIIPQPEGICFDENANLFIASEGQGFSAKLLNFLQINTDMNLITRTFLYSVIIASCFSCGTYHRASYNDENRDWASSNLVSSKKLIHSLYLVGDTGEIDDHEKGTNNVLDALKEDLAVSTVETSLVFLGDNIYPRGLPVENSPEREEAEIIINAQLDCAQAHHGKTYFIPGNHDWNKHKAGGRKAIKRQEEYIESYFGDKGPEVNFYPNNACGDPKLVKVNKDLVFIFLDSQWWLQDWTQEKKMNHGCDIKSRGDLLDRVEEMMVEHKNDEIVIMLHHPIKSDGTHGGKFSLKQHIFPLTELKDNLWIPLPIIGSSYAAYRKITGARQDIPNIHNQAMMQSLDQLAKRLRVNVIFASGHDHGMQHFEENKIQYIVSGGGGKIDYVSNGGEADYARSGRGYAVVNFHEDFEIWVEYYIVDFETGESALEFRKQLRKPRAGTVPEENKYPSVTEKKITRAANKEFAAGPLHKLFLGSQYRALWATPVEAEVIDLETKFGGLTPIKKGGGMASNSLRMELEDGRQYILRSIKKDYTKLLPSDFENLKLVNIMADQNSASHPYNALIIPTLSKAAGIYYTDPKLVYLQHQKGLGNYNSQFPEELYLLEERPSGNWEHAAQFGNAKEIIGYVDLLDKLREKKNHYVDQKWVLKSRMFDLWIHDWDRHDDQWRWIKSDEDGKHIYRPIPRDRDQAFYRFKGIVPWYISTFMVKQFKTIKEDCKDVKHLAFNARHFDRYFLNELQWKDWEEIIVKMQNDISDADIDAAIDKFPKEVMSLNDDEELFGLLKARRDNLLKIGKRHYDYLNEEIEITGTDKNDHFYIDLEEDGSFNVKYTIKGKDDKILTKYERKIFPSETNEVRIYGLRGKDKFTISGGEKTSINLRIIGGEGKDKFENISQNPNVLVYDDLNGIEIQGLAKDRRSDAIDVNEYDRYGFQYDTSMPMLSFGNSVDDGWWFGGSLSWVNKGWRKYPYKSKHGFSFSAAPGSRDAVQIGYEADFPDIVKGLDFIPQLDLDFPYYENYFGLGNNSNYDLTKSIEYNWVRMQAIDFNLGFKARIGNNAAFNFGPLYQQRKILNTTDRVSEDPRIGFDALDFEYRRYLGGDVKYTLGSVDNKVFPTNGFKLQVSALQLFEIEKGEQVREVSISAQFYLRILNRPRAAFVTQLGYARSYGDLQFYQFADIGNNNGLRGFRNERFRGRKSFFQNLDLRVKLIKWNNTILPMDIGILGGYDYGRVTLDQFDLADWKTSQTIGVWFEILGSVVLQPYYSFNEEQNTFSLQMGFNF